jgi:hypothetical protein
MLLSRAKLRGRLVSISARIQGTLDSALADLNRSSRVEGVEIECCSELALRGQNSLTPTTAFDLEYLFPSWRSDNLVTPFKILLGELSGWLKRP